MSIRGVDGGDGVPKDVVLLSYYIRRVFSGMYSEGVGGYALRGTFFVLIVTTAYGVSPITAGGSESAAIAPAAAGEGGWMNWINYIRSKWSRRSSVLEKKRK